MIYIDLLLPSCFDYDLMISNDLFCLLYLLKYINFREHFREIEKIAFREWLRFFVKFVYFHAFFFIFSTSKHFASIIGIFFDWFVSFYAYIVVFFRTSLFKSLGYFNGKVTVPSSSRSEKVAWQWYNCFTTVYNCNYNYDTLDENC